MSIKHLKLGKEYTVEEIGRKFKCKIEDHTVGWHIEDRYVILLLTLDKEYMENSDLEKFTTLSAKEQRREIYYYRDYFDIEKKLFHWEGPTDLDENDDDIKSFINNEKDFYLFVREYWKKTANDTPYEKFTYTGRIKYKAHNSTKYKFGRPVAFDSKLIDFNDKDDKGKLAELYRWKSSESEIAQEQFLRNQEDDKQGYKKWLTSQEGKWLDYKAIFFSKNPMWTDRCLKTVCAFANTDGGYLIIGVKDPTKENQIKKNKLHTVTGIEKDIKFESKDDYSTKITNRIKASFKNVTIDYIRYHECPDGLHICEIKINRLVRTGNPCKYKDKYYERVVDTTREIPMDQEINFIDHWKDN